MKAQSHLWLWQCGSYLGSGMFSSCIWSTLVPVCAMKGIHIEPLAQWGKALAYYLAPLLCLENWDMYYPGGACRGKDLPPARILYILHTKESTPAVQWLSYSPLDLRFAGSIPAGVDGFFQSVKILSMTSFGWEVKPWAPWRRFTARKRTSAEIRAKFVGLFTLYVGSDADDLRC